MNKSIYSKKNVLLSISAVLIVIAVIMQIVGVGMALDYDYRGGTLVKYVMKGEYSSDEIEAALEGAGISGYHIQLAEGSTQTLGTDSLLQIKKDNAESADDGEAVDETDVEEPSEEAVEEVEVETTEEPETETSEEQVDEASEVEEVDESADIAESEAELEVERTEGYTDVEIIIDYDYNYNDLRDAVSSAVEAAVTDSRLTGFRALSLYDAIESEYYDENYETDLAGAFEESFQIDGVESETFDKTSFENAVSEAVLPEGVSASRIDFYYEDGSQEDEDGNTVNYVTARAVIKVDDDLSAMVSSMTSAMQGISSEAQLFSVDGLGAANGSDITLRVLLALVVAAVVIAVYMILRYGKMGYVRSLFAGISTFVVLIYDVAMTIALSVILRAFVKVDNSYPASIAIVAGISLIFSIMVFSSIWSMERRQTDRSPRDMAYEAAGQTTLTRLVMAVLLVLALIIMAVLVGNGMTGIAVAAIVGIIVALASSTMLTGQIWAGMLGKHDAKIQVKREAEIQEEQRMREARQEKKQAAKSVPDKNKTAVRSYSKNYTKKTKEKNS